MSTIPTLLGAAIAGFGALLPREHISLPLIKLAIKGFVTSQRLMPVKLLETLQKLSCTPTLWHGATSSGLEAMA